MKNRHALIDNKTGIVRNIIIWDGAEWLPPRDHFVVHDCDGQIGDYWHMDSNAFYTSNHKKRIRVDGKVGEIELTDEEKSSVLPVLQEKFLVK